MGMITVTLRDGQKPTREELAEIRAAVKAAKKNPADDPDCPPSTPEALAEFAAKARELRRNIKRTKPSVSIRLTPDCLLKYKSLGKGYTGIMADVLAAAADNPDFLAKVIGR